MGGTPVTASDVNFSEIVMPGAPPGWNSARDLMETFLLVGGLEMQLRRSLSPRDPFAPWVLERLPDEYRFDTLGSLIRHGEITDAQMNEPAFSDNPLVNYAHHGHKLHAGEKIGRLPLIGLVWQFTDEVFAALKPLRDEESHPERSWEQALQKLDGFILGKHATALFMAAFQRRWFEDGPERERLQRVEVEYLLGHDIPGVGGMGRLAAAGHLYEESLWNTTWRLVERRPSGYYVDRYADRRPVVLDVLRRGAELARGRARNCWPGWPG